MKIPLNIDLQQIFLHLFNFSVLVLGLYLLLYNPVKKFMDEREGHYHKLDNDANEKQKEAETLKLAYQERLDDLELEIEERRSKSIEEAQQTADKMLQEAKEQVEKMLADAEESARQVRAKMLEETEREITDMTLSVTEKILTQSGSEALDQFLKAGDKE